MIVVCAIHTTFPQIPEHCSPTKYARVSSCSHGDVVMLFCSSFSPNVSFKRSAHHQSLIHQFQLLRDERRVGGICMSCVAGCLLTILHLWCSQVHSGSTNDEHLPNVEAKRSRAHEEAGQRRIVRGVPRRSEPHSPSAAPAPEVGWGKSRE